MASKTILRWLTIVAAVALLAAACSDDDSTTDVGGSGDAPSSESSDGEESDGEESDGEESGDDPAPAASGGSYDCAELSNAIESAGNVAGDPTAAGSGDPQADFEQSRASLAALKDQVPELSADVDAALAGMDKIGAALASIGWDTSNLAADPAAALELAQIVGDADVLAMAGALSSISTWFASNCT